MMRLSLNLSAALFSALVLSACGNATLPLMRQPAQFGVYQARQASNLPQRAVTTISVKEAHQWLSDANASWKLLDLRTPEEFAQGRLQGAELMNFYDKDFRDRLLKMDRNQPYIIYCRSGNRSGQALAIMRELGFRNAYDIQGGILAWQTAGYPVIK